MKKVVSSLLACSLAIMMSFSSVFAASYDVSKLDNAYNEIVKFYKENNTLESHDEIIAVESLGLEVENEFDVSDLLEQFKEMDYENATIGDLTKTIIALSLIGENPNQFNNQNLVDILEKYVENEDDIIYKEDASKLTWVLFALETINSNNVDKIASYMISTNQHEEGGFISWGYQSTDVTGWAIEALTIAGKDKYSESIDKAINYLQKNLNSDGSYSYSNADTQACVLEGLFVYDKEGLLDGKYNYLDINPIDYLLIWMQNGYFTAEDYLKDENGNYIVDENGFWIPNGEYIYNRYATMEGARNIGTYKNGSFVLKAQK